MQGRNRDADAENGHMDMAGGRREMNWEIGDDIYTLTCVKQIASGNLLNNTGGSAWCSVMT